MAPPILPVALRREALAAFKAAGGNLAKAAAALGLSRGTMQGRLAAAQLHGVGDDPPEASAVIGSDLTEKASVAEARDLKRKYLKALDLLEERDRQLAEATAIAASPIDTYAIEPAHRSGTGEGTVVVLASDWHVEERIDPAVVSGLNAYTLDVARASATEFFQHAARLTQILQQDIRIDTMVLALLGDFITNDIHEDMPDANAVTPTHAVIAAQTMIASGLAYLLDHTKLSLVIPCHSGNHARTTRTTRFAVESGHSLEFLMYRHLAAYFRHEPRVTFLIAGGYHSYMQIYGLTLRFHHGHAIRYAGGVGGLYIPVNKAIAQWQKGRRADLDVFGHFHQLRDGGNFICNGSMIGYSPFALSVVKADYEPPKQALFLLDKKRGRTCTWPILFTPR
jgi:hypothetical protein